MGLRHKREGSGSISRKVARSRLSNLHPTVACLASPGSLLSEECEGLPSPALLVQPQPLRPPKQSNTGHSTVRVRAGTWSWYAAAGQVSGEPALRP